MPARAAGTQNVEGTTEPAAPAPVAASNWDQVLSEVAPAIAKVGCEDNWYSGFLISSTLVVTTLYAVTQYCTPEVLMADDEPIAVEVVAWSNDDNIAIVRLAAPSKARPLRPAADSPAVRVGDEVALVAAGVDYNRERRQWKDWLHPRMRWGRVGAVAPELVLDVGLPRSDYGAPILSSSGEVIGVVVATFAMQGPVKAQPWSNIGRLRDGIGQQGQFSRPWEVGMTTAMMFSVRPADNHTGAYFVFGATLDWFALQGGLGIWGRPPLPAPGDRVADEGSIGLDAEANARYMLPWHSYLLGGVGVQALSRTTRSWPIGDEDAEQTSSDDRRIVFLSLAYGWSYLQTRVVIGLNEPEFRLDVGLSFGRY